MADVSRFTPTTGLPEPKEVKKVEVEVKIPQTDEEAIELVRKNSSAIQFKNALIYIQGGTNVTLDRMINRFEVVLAEILMEGVELGLKFAKESLK